MGDVGYFWCTQKTPHLEIKTLKFTATGKTYIIYPHAKEIRSKCYAFSL